MTSTEVRAEFPPWVQVIASDQTYAKPTVHWLREVFWPWFRARRQSIGLLSWSRTNDCDNFARSFAQSAADCHALSLGASEEGLAVGEFFYIGTTHVQGAHAIVVAFTDEGKVYLEPQTGGRLALTPTEELSVFHVRI